MIKLTFSSVRHRWSRYPVKTLCFYCSQNFKLFGFPIFWFWAYLMKLSQKLLIHTKFDIYVFLFATSRNWQWELIENEILQEERRFIFHISMEQHSSSIRNIYLSGHRYSKDCITFKGFPGRGLFLSMKLQNQRFPGAKI